MMSERGGTREGLSIREQSRKVVEGLSALGTISKVVATTVKNSYTDLPTSEAAVGTKESEALTKARKQMTMKLLVFRNCHLSEMDRVVKNLDRTLGYFKQDYDNFKKVLRFARPVLKESEEHALFVKKIFVELTVELVKLGEDSNEALKAAKTNADGQLASAMVKAGFASAVENEVAASMAFAGVAGGIVLAFASIGPAGLLFAPACAIPAIVGSSAAGVIGATAAGAAAEALKKGARQKQRVVDAIGEAGKVYETVFVHALKEFAGLVQAVEGPISILAPQGVPPLACAIKCLWASRCHPNAECTGDFAGYFHSIGSQLDDVISNGASVPDEALKSLYDTIQDEKEELNRACGDYWSHIFDTRVDIGVLERFQHEGYSSYIDEWYKKCQTSQWKSLRMTQGLLEKAVDACPVPSLAWLSKPFRHFTLGFGVQEACFAAREACFAVRDACFAVALFSFACLLAARAVGRFL